MFTYIDPIPVAPMLIASINIVCVSLVTYLFILSINTITDYFYPLSFTLNFMTFDLTMFDGAPIPYYIYMHLKRDKLRH